MMTDKRIRQLVSLIFTLVFITALTQTAFCTKNCAHSLLVFLLGWLGMLIEASSILSGLIDSMTGNSGALNSSMGASFTWLANPIMLISLIILKYNCELAKTLWIISTLIILSFLLFDKVLGNEAGHYHQIESYGLGYWLWLMASITILIGSLVLAQKKITKGNNG